LPDEAESARAMNIGVEVVGVSDLNCWPDFKTQYNATFIRTVRAQDRRDALRRRNQNEHEHSMDLLSVEGETAPRSLTNI